MIQLLRRLLNWVKSHKLTAFLLLVVAYFLFKGFLGSLFGVATVSRSVNMPGFFDTSPGVSSLPSVKLQPGIGGGGTSYYPPYTPPAPAPEVQNRMVVAESHLSLLVKNVAQTLKSIKDKTTFLGGYMVDSNLSNPQEAASGQITVRVPQEKLDLALEYFRTLSVKVVSENLRGTDVTDQYVDIDARLKPLLTNKERFEEIMNQAAKIEDILRIQQEIINLQSQIDNLRGQQNYLAKTAEMSKITIYLSTDELALPYAPSQPWRAEVIFRQAVRSLIGNLRSLGTLTIWILVYSVIWLPILLVILYFRSRLKKSPLASK